LVKAALVTAFAFSDMVAWGHWLQRGNTMPKALRIRKSHNRSAWECSFTVMLLKYLPLDAQTGKRAEQILESIHEYPHWHGLDSDPNVAVHEIGLGLEHLVKLGWAVCEVREDGGIYYLSSTGVTYLTLMSPAAVHLIA
jgi:hypothetical protein